MSSEKRHKPERVKGEGGLFQIQHRGEVKWRATKPRTVTLTTANGEQQKVTKVISGTGTTRQEALRRLEENLRKFADQSQAQQAENRRKPVTLTSYYREKFLTSRKAEKWTPGTRRGVTQRIEQHVLPTLGAKRLGSISKDDIRNLFNQVLPSKNLSEATQVNTWRNLYTLLGMAVYDEVLTVNPMTLIRPEERPQKKRAEAVHLPQTLVTDIQRRVIGTEEELLRMTSMMLGLRQGELLGLTWDCVHLEEGATVGLLEIRQQLQYLNPGHGEGCQRNRGGEGWECGKRPANCPKHPEPQDEGLVIVPWVKTNPRSVALVEPLIGLLKEQKNRQSRWKQTQAWKPLEREGMGDLIFTTPEGKPLTPQKVAKDWKTLLAECGHPTLTAHKSRYISATALILNGVPLTVASSILGHADSRITEQIYTQISTADQAKHLQGIGKQYSEARVKDEAQRKSEEWKLVQKLISERQQFVTEIATRNALLAAADKLFGTNPEEATQIQELVETPEGFTEASSIAIRLGQQVSVETFMLEARQQKKGILWEAVRENPEWRKLVNENLDKERQTA